MKSFQTMINDAGVPEDSTLYHQEFPHGFKSLLEFFKP